MNSKHIYLFLFLLASQNTSFSQNDKYAYGYVVTTNKDTIRGRIKLLDQNRSCHAVKIATDSKVKTFNPKEVISYLSGNDRYESQLNSMGNRVFMKKIVSGKIKMFYFYFQSLPTSATLGGLAAYALKNKYVIVYLLREGEAKPTKITSEGFKNRMSEYVKDSPELALRIKNKELRYDQIISRPLKST